LIVDVSFKTVEMIFQTKNCSSGIKERTVNLQRIISAPQLSAPVIIIKIEFIITPDCANAKKESNVPALSKVSTPAPRHPSLLKKL